MPKQIYVKGLRRSMPQIIKTTKTITTTTLDLTKDILLQVLWWRPQQSKTLRP